MFIRRFGYGVGADLMRLIDTTIKGFEKFNSFWVATDLLKIGKHFTACRFLNGIGDSEKRSIDPSW